MKAAYFDNQFTRDIQKTFSNFRSEVAASSAYAQIFDVRNTSEYTSSITSTEGIKQPTWFNESQNLTQNRLEKGFKVTYESEEFGHKIVVSKKVRNKARDNLNLLAEYIVEERDDAIAAMHHFMEKETHRVLNNATNTTYFQSPDGLSLANAAHGWNSGSATWSNILVSSPFSTAVIDAAMAYGGAFQDAQGNQMPLGFDTIICKTGGAASRAIKKTLGLGTASQYLATSIGAINLYFGEFTVIETPFLTSGNEYFFMDRSGQYSNPLFIDIIESPSVEEMMVDQGNLDYIYPVTASIKIGIQNQPFNLLYNAGL